MSDTTFLDWPFLEDRHRELRAGLDDWCSGHAFPHDDDVDAACRGLVSALGAAGILKHCVPAGWGGAQRQHPPNEDWHPGNDRKR